MVSDQVTLCVLYFLRGKPFLNNLFDLRSCNAVYLLNKLPISADVYTHTTNIKGHLVEERESIGIRVFLAQHLMDATTHSRENRIHNFYSVSVVVNNTWSQETEDKMALHHFSINGNIAFLSRDRIFS